MSEPGNAKIVTDKNIDDIIPLKELIYSITTDDLSLTVYCKIYIWKLFNLHTDNTIWRWE